MRVAGLFGGLSAKRTGKKKVNGQTNKRYASFQTRTFNIITDRKLLSRRIPEVNC